MVPCAGEDRRGIGEGCAILVRGQSAGGAPEDLNADNLHRGYLRRCGQADIDKACEILAWDSKRAMPI